MANTLVVVTGDKQLDARLAKLPPKLQGKLGRKALRKGGKRVQEKFRKIVLAEAYETGAYLKSAKVRALPRKRNTIGVTLHIDREKYFQEYEKQYGHKPTPIAGGADPFYVPAGIEFGTKTQEAVRPQRRALYENEQNIVSDFRSDVSELIREA